MLLDPCRGEPADEGEICLRSTSRPLGLMVGYRDDDERTSEAMRDGYYHTGDVATRDADGYITYVGRTDDVFKASDYRISPFELESVLIEHEAVAEAAVVPSPDPLRLAVPKAFVVLAAGFEPSRETALSILRYAREHLAPYKRIRRIEFDELPKTISGKIRRVELRAREEGDDVGRLVARPTSRSCTPSLQAAHADVPRPLRAADPHARAEPGAAHQPRAERRAAAGWAVVRGLTCGMAAARGGRDRRARARSWRRARPCSAG